MQNISVNKKVGTWILKQGSINTVLADATAISLLATMGSDRVKLKIPDGCTFGVMAIKSGEVIYKLFAFQLKEAESLLPTYALENYYAQVCEQS